MGHLGVKRPAKTCNCKLLLPPGKYKREVGWTLDRDSTFDEITLVPVNIHNWRGDKNGGAYEWQPGREARVSGRWGQGKNHRLHPKPKLPHPTATEYLEARRHDSPAQASAAKHSITRRQSPYIHWWLVGWARFNVPLDTVSVISETMFLQVRWPNQQCQSTEGGWIQIALDLTRLISPCYNNTTCMHIQDNDTQRNLSTASEPSEMKQNLVD